jgi:hypothetical protein
MKKQPWVLPCAVGLALMLLGPASGSVYARGRGGRGFSREGPAAHGGFASREKPMEGHEGGFQAGRQQYAAGAQANREQYGAHAQANRQQEANALQANREQTAQRMQSNAQQYRGGYPYAASAYPAWDAGAGAAALGAATAAGAAIGAAAGSSGAGPSSATAGYSASEPCADPVTISALGTQFYRCGSTWYRQALGPTGPTFVAVRRPGL